MSNYIHYYKMWDKITNPFPNFNDVGVKVWADQQFYTTLSNYSSMLGLKLIHVSKRSHKWVEMGIIGYPVIFMCSWYIHLIKNRSRFTTGLYRTRFGLAVWLQNYNFRIWILQYELQIMSETQPLCDLEAQGTVRDQGDLRCRHFRRLV